VLLVYPGPAKELESHAKEFARSKKLPANFHFVVDPDYKFTKAYDLHWDAPKETAYPSTFVVETVGGIAKRRQRSEARRTVGSRSVP
jgi:peroxiredoxin Q/BCP